MSDFRNRPPTKSPPSPLPEAPKVASVPIAALEHISGPDTASVEALNGGRYGASDVTLPPYPCPAPLIVPIPSEDASRQIYHIFMLCPITNSGTFTNAVADIVHILDHAGADDLVVFYLASPGGVLNVAARIVAALQRTLAHTITIAVGLVASAGSFIWSYGKDRQVVPGAVLMFHMSKHGDYGHTPAIAQNASAFTIYVQEVAFAHLVEAGVLTSDEVGDIVDRRRELYLSYVDVMSRMGVEVNHD